MRIRWDENKRRLVLKKRNINFAHLKDMISLPYLEDQLLDNPEQYRLIGFVGSQITTFIVEYREDNFEQFIWVVTAWKSTRQEEKSYEQIIW